MEEFLIYALIWVIGTAVVMRIVYKLDGTITLNDLVMILLFWIIYLFIFIMIGMGEILDWLYNKGKDIIIFGKK
jgi:hypothetical protein